MKNIAVFLCSVACSLALSVVAFRSIGFFSGKGDVEPSAIESVLLTKNIWSCGLEALAFAAGQIERPISSNDLEVISKSTIGGVGYISVADLKSAAQQVGLDACVIDMTHAEEVVARMDRQVAAIVHVDFERSGHYITIRRLNDSYEVMDPGQGISVVSQTELSSLLEKRSTGVAILIANSERLAAKIGNDFPLSPRSAQSKAESEESAPTDSGAFVSGWNSMGNLRFPEIVGLKMPELGATVSVPLELKNYGPKKIVIKEVKGSCGCFGGVVGKMPLILDPAEQATLHLRFHLTSSERALGKSTGVLILTDSSPSSLIPVAVEMRSMSSAKPFVVDPLQSLGIIDSSRPISRRFTILRRSGMTEPMKIDSIETSSDAVKVLVGSGRLEVFGGVKYESIQVTVSLNSLYPGENECSVRLNIRSNGMDSVRLGLRAFLL